MRIGTDIISVARIEEMIARHGARFQTKFFSAEERAYCDAKAYPARHYAGKFAAKEAVAKVLRIGWDRGFAWSDIRILNASDGAPTASLAGIPAEFAREQGLSDGRFEVSVSHCDEYATATAIWWPVGG